MKQSLFLCIISVLHIASSLSYQPFDISKLATEQFSMHCEATEPEYISYILRIKFPESIKKTPSLCGYYKGYNLEFDTDYCILHEEQTCDHFTLAITEQVYRKSDEKNLQYLERLPKQKCRLFYISRNNEKNKKPWTIEEEAQNNIPKKLPRTAIVLFLNPDHIDSITCEKENYKTTGIIQRPVVTLPYIAIKSTVSQKELEITSISSLLASLDSRALHPHMPKETRIERSAIVSMRRFSSSLNS